MMQYYLCHGPDAFWPDYYLYRMHHVLTDKYFGVPLDFNEWHHIYELVNIEFEKKQVASEIKSMLSKAIWSYRVDNAQWMAWTVDEMDVTAADTIKFQVLSELYHNFLELDKEVRYFKPCARRKTYRHWRRS